MKHWKIKLSLFLNYVVFAILLNSVGTVILQVQRNYGVTQSAASVLEAFKDLSIAAVSFVVASYITRIGYKNAMLIALGAIAAVCLLMPSLPGFAMTKLLFAATGTCFALIKVSVYASIGLIEQDQKNHASFMNFIESFFMVGILAGYFVFGAFTDDASAASTEWLRVYYLLAAIAAAAFVLLLATPLDESAVRQHGHAPLVNDLAQMFRLALTTLAMVFIASVFFLAGLASLGLPGLAGFVAEFTTFIGSYSVFPLATILCVCTIAITAGYILWRLGSVFYGPLVEEWATLGDAIWRERIAVGILAAATLLIGVVPSVVTDLTAPGVAPIAAAVAQGGQR